MRPAKVPIVFVKTPYNFNFWDVRNGVPADMSTIIAAIKRGYAWVGQNERGHFFSEGHYDILGAPITDGYETIDYLSKQPWSNGKVGTTGCSSTAEWQPAVASLGHPGFAAMNVQGFGAGVGKVGPYWEQGNWYRGGAMQMLFITWIYGQQNQVRPMFPKDTPREDLIAASRLFDLAPRMPPVDWDKALWHLPTQDIIKNVEGPRGIFADKMPVETGGMMQQREPASDAWRKGGLWHDDMALNVPGLWFMSWYDVSVGPNLEMFNHVRRTAKPPMRDQQWAIIAPVAHCSFTRATEKTIVGERNMGDARLDYNEIMYGFFDKFLKGDANGRIEKQAKVTYYTMGSNRWQTSDVWPPAGSQPMTFHLSSGGRANSLTGDGQLTMTAPEADTPDVFTYDPMNPVPSYGGNVCCTGNAITAGSFDQRKMESRNDILVYTSEPFKEGHRGERANRADDLRVVRRERHRLHRQGARRVSRRPRLQPRRVDPAHALPRRLRQESVDGEGQGLQGHLAAVDDEQLLCGGPPAAHRSVEQQLPALRSQPEHRRQQFRRNKRSGGAQQRPPLEAVPVEPDGDGGPAAGRDGQTAPRCRRTWRETVTNDRREFLTAARRDSARSP